MREAHWQVTISMKFLYVDESGDNSQGDIFVMTGILVDATRLTKHTKIFDEKVDSILEQSPKNPCEIKTKQLIGGKNKWKGVNPGVRKALLEAFVTQALEFSKIYAIALSLSAFREASQKKDIPFNGHWAGAAMFLLALLQKKMLTVKRNKGLTVVIFDDNPKGMSVVSQCLHAADAWFDPIYQQRKKIRRKNVWKEIPARERFSMIVNSTFSTMSEHSSFIQVVDAISYVYRRHLELIGIQEEWQGEKDYFNSLVSKLEENREKLGRTANGQCIDFYRQVKCENWNL